MMQPIEYFLNKRGDYCENCGRPFTYFNWAERHHAIIRRSKKHPEYDSEENISLICSNCHKLAEIDSYEYSRKFWKKQISRGYDMKKWLDSLNLKAKENYD